MTLLAAVLARSALDRPERSAPNGKTTLWHPAYLRHGPATTATPKKKLAERADRRLAEQTTTAIV